ncbi:MAG: hypothetical protein KC492_23980 [Myxococcales bacterium]|nr:hypothetical protein [Myxococcales bacterium]
MRIEATAAFLCLLAATAVGADTSGEIPGDVTQLATGRAQFDGKWSDFRLVITGYCSPEHCFSRGRIEWVDGSIPGTSTVVKTVSVEELESVLVVNSVEFHPMRGASEPASFEVRAVNTYTGQGGVIALQITGVGRYKANIVGDPLGPPPEGKSD